MCIRDSPKGANQGQWGSGGVKQSKVVDDKAHHDLTRDGKNYGLNCAQMRKQQDISSKRNHAEQTTEPNPQRFPKCTGNAEFAAGDGCRNDKQSHRAHGKRNER